VSEPLAGAAKTVAAGQGGVTDRAAARSAEGMSRASRVSKVARTGRRLARMRAMTAPLSDGERWAPRPDRSGGESGKGRGQGPRTARGVLLVRLSLTLYPASDLRPCEGTGKNTNRSRRLLRRERGR